MRSRGLGTWAWGLAGAAVVVAVLLAHFLGVSAYVITGGSMTGAIPKGSLAIERRVPANTLQTGDIITFQPPEGSGVVTHRITSIELGKDGRRIYRTKGDANEAGDPWLITLDRPDQARVLTSIPWLGYVLAAFTLRAVRVALLVAVALQILVSVILWFRKEPTEEDEDYLGAGGWVRR